LRLLPPRLAQGATVILTTSGTRDPAEKTIIAPRLHADARFLALCWRNSIFLKSRMRMPCQTAYRCSADQKTT
jgi:hypothetical protein